MSEYPEADELDARDPLGHKRAEFDLDSAVCYLDGNSLGAPLRVVATRLTDVVREQWAGRLIRGWPEGWWDAPTRVGDRIASLLGAEPGQVIVCDSTSVNVFKAVVAAVRLNPGRGEVLLDADTFPSDGYIADAAARLTGHRVRRVAASDMPGVVSAHTAVALVNHVDYVSGTLHDLHAITAELHRAGALALWDLCHSVGAMPIELDNAGVDLAVGCTYKFLNGGPGAPAFLYVATGHLDQFDQPLAGWAGHREPFGMRSGYAAGAGIERARTGTPDILSLLALDAALDVWDGVTLEQVREKGLALGDFFLRCLDQQVQPVRVLSPRDHARGNQVSVTCPDAETLMRALADRDVLGDVRPPDVLRFGLAPLYTRYRDVARAAAELAELTGATR